MNNLDCTPEESARILRGVDNYADDEWVNCPDCGGSCEARDGSNCCTCHGQGEVPVILALERVK